MQQQKHFATTTAWAADPAVQSHTENTTMSKRTWLLTGSLLLCLGVTCNISIPGQTTTLPLDEANAVIRITRIASGLQANVASVVADITDSCKTAVELQGNQSV